MTRVISLFLPGRGLSLDAAAATALIDVELLRSEREGGWGGFKSESLRQICVYNCPLIETQWSDIRVTRQGRRAHVRRRSRDRARPAARPLASDAGPAVVVHARAHIRVRAHAHAHMRARTHTHARTSAFKLFFYCISSPCCWQTLPLIATCQSARTHTRTHFQRKIACTCLRAGI